MASNINENTKTTESQEKQIFDYLQAGNSLTAIEALNKFRCFRLASRINDIEKHKGIKIYRQTIKTASGKHVSQYNMQPFEPATNPNTKDTSSKLFAPIYIAGEFHAEASERLVGMLSGNGVKHDDNNRISRINSLVATEAKIKATFKQLSLDHGVSICALGSQEHAVINDVTGMESNVFTAIAILCTPEGIKWSEKRNLSTSEYYEDCVENISPIERELLAKAANVSKVEFAHTSHLYPMFHFADGRKCLLKDFAKPEAAKQSFLSRLLNRKKEAV